MGDKSKIEWTDASWTPIRARNKVTGRVGWHCEHATPGCENCYSETLNRRLGTGLLFKPGHRKDVEMFLDEKMLTQPLRWQRPRMIFVCSMTDLFADFVPDEWLDQVFAVMALAPQHVFQVLTKRIDRMWGYIRSKKRKAPEWVSLPEIGGKVLLPYEGGVPTNVWIGVSVEDQRRADERIPALLDTPAAVRWISAEPLLGPVDLTNIWPDGTASMDALVGRASHSLGMVERTACLDWVVAGGESGPGARPMHPSWARDLRDQCAATGVAFHFKQWGAWSPSDLDASDSSPHGWLSPDGTLVRGDILDVKRSPCEKPCRLMYQIGKRAAGRLLDGRTHDEWPSVHASRS